MENCLLQLSKKSLEILKNGKNLLAFSHGSDSTALFYLLKQENVDFSVAIVNYHTRKNSNLESQNAEILCHKFDVKFHKFDAFLDLKQKNFEATARKIRYDFFNYLMQNFGYKNLILAHQLNDKLEWFLMQLSKGSGLANLLSMDEIEKKKNFYIIRPLIFTPKDEILNFLKENKILYFDDESNHDLKFKRNYIRQNFSDKFLQNFSNGVKKSFEFLNVDKNRILGDFEFENGEFFLIEKDEKAINLIDKAVKILGVLMSEKQREICLQDCVISGKICVCNNEKFYFVSPFVKVKMDKKFKEFCRINKIPRLIRPYMFLKQNILDFKKIKDKIQPF